MASVELVMLVESPGSVARGLQRIGRAGHAVGETSRGIVFPKHRGDLLEAVVVAKGVVVALLAAVTLARQAEFNHAVARLLTGAAHGVQSLENGSDVLRHRLGELERANRELQARCDQLQAEVHNLRGRPGPAGHAEEPG